MAHYRKPIAAAVGLNTGIFVVEAVAGYRFEPEPHHGQPDEQLEYECCRTEAQANKQT
jgi:hypothetical protein